MLENSIFPRNNVPDDYTLKIQELNQARSTLEHQRAATKTNPWIELENELQSLTAEQRNAIQTDKLYLEEEQGIMQVIQLEMMEFIKPRILANQSYVQLINGHIETIKRFKKEFRTQEEIEMQELREYKANYSHISFEEFQSLKSKKGKK